MRFNDVERQMLKLTGYDKAFVNKDGFVKEPSRESSKERASRRASKEKEKEQKDVVKLKSTSTTSKDAPVAERLKQLDAEIAERR